MRIIFNISLFILILSLNIEPCQAGEKTIVLNDSISLFLKEDSINSKEYFKNYKKIILIDYIRFIDDKPVYGIDDKPPDTILSELTLMINKKEISLNVSYMYDPILHLIGKNQINLIIINNLIKMDIIFSDGAGTYAAQWLIFDHESTRTILSSNEGIIHSMFSE